MSLTNIVELRQPRWARVYVTAFSLLWCGAVVAGGIAALNHRPATAIVPLIMLLFGGTFGYRLSRLAVRADANTLTVRNNWSTRVIARRDVEGFRVGSPSSAPIGKVIHVLLHDDTVLALDVTAEPYMLKGGRLRMQKRLEQLQRWQAG